MRRVTLSDIARACGVSVNTVSHALHDKPDISEQTKDRIKKTAEEMGYIQNTSASFLRSGVSKTIAIIVGDISNPHFSIIIKAMEATARQYGYTCFVLNTDENEDIEHAAIIASISKNVDGILICPCQKSDRNIQFLIRSKIPFVLFGRKFDDLETNYVVCDDINSGYLAADYIIKRGCKKIAVINAGLHISSSRERLNGIENYYRENGLILNPDDVYTLAIDQFDHCGDLNKILVKDYDGAICFNDVIALELLACADRTIQVVSFDNIRSKFIFPYSFACVSSSKIKMSQEAMLGLIRSINGDSAPVQMILPVSAPESIL